MASLIAKERELITARLRELDDVEKRMNQVQDEKEKKKEMFSEKKLKLKEQKRKVNEGTSKLNRKLTAMKEVKLTKDLQWKNTIERYGVRKMELKSEITVLEQKINEIEKKSTPLKIPDNSDCAVCLGNLCPPKKIYQCEEGHIVCDSCLKNLTKRKTCPTCRCVGNFSRNRVLEDLHARVAEESKVPQKKRRLDRMLADEQIGTLIERTEALAKELNHIRGLEEQISKEKDAFAKEISDVKKERSTLKEKESDISEDLKNLEWKCSLMEKDYDRRIREERENNQLVALKDMKRDRRAELKSVVLGYQHITKELKREIFEIGDLPWNCGDEYVWATDVVIFHVEIDGDKIPPIQIFMTGKDFPRTVRKFLQLCKSDYKESRIEKVEKGHSIQGGYFYNAQVFRSDTKCSSRSLKGDVIMLHSPDAEDNMWFSLELEETRDCDDTVVVGKVLDMAPGSGVDKILEKARHDSHDPDSVVNQIIIRDITILPLSKPVILNEYREDEVEEEDDEDEDTEDDEDEDEDDEDDGENEEDGDDGED